MELNVCLSFFLKQQYLQQNWKHRNLAINYNLSICFSLNGQARIMFDLLKFKNIDMFIVQNFNVRMCFIVSIKNTLFIDFDSLPGASQVNNSFFSKSASSKFIFYCL